MAKYKAKGVILKFGATAAPTAVVTNKAEVGLDDGDRQLLDSTTHENATTKSWLDSGLRDTFGLACRLLLDPADTVHELLRSAHNTGTTHYATLVLPDAGAAEWTGPVVVTSYQVPGMTPDGLLEVNVRIKFVDAETFTA
jgi:hypothetical protein